MGAFSGFGQQMQQYMAQNPQPIGGGNAQQTVGAQAPRPPATASTVQNTGPGWSPYSTPYGTPGAPTTPAPTQSNAFSVTPAMQQTVASGVNNPASWTSEAPGSYNYTTNQISDAALAGGQQNSQAYNEYWNALTQGGFNSTFSDAMSSLSPAQYQQAMTNPAYMQQIIASQGQLAQQPGYGSSPGGAFATSYNPNTTGAPISSTGVYQPAQAAAQQQAAQAAYTGQPTAAGGATAPTMFPSGQAQAVGGSTGLSPLSALASEAGGLSFDQQIASGQGAGASVNTTPAWQQMVQAMQYNTQEGSNNLSAQLAATGNLNSSGATQSLADYYTNTANQQQAMLSQMAVPAMEQAQQLQASAGGALGQFGNSAVQTLGQDSYSSQMAQYQAQLAAAQSMLGSGTTAASILDQLSGSATNNLNAAAVAGGTGLYNTQNTASEQQAADMMSLLGMNMSGYSNLSSLWDSNLSTGASLGSQQYTEEQNAINNAYQQYYQTNPDYNPLLSMMYSASTNEPTLAYPSFQTGSLGSILGGLGGLAGGAGQLASIINSINNSSNYGSSPITNGTIDDDTWYGLGNSFYS